MTLKVRILPEASAEFDDAANWCEKRSRGRGGLFSDAVIDALDRIREQPDYYPIIRGKIRQAKIPKYPFCVFYKEMDAWILIIAIFHTSRNPEIWQMRDS